MKKVLLGICSLWLALGMSSCSEDFDVAAPYKDITLVYGLLNYGDTAQYIRIQKAFLDQNRSSLEIAKIPDSNYYRNIEVHMKEFTPANNQVSDLILNKVDLAAEGFPKQPGTFFTSPNYAYKYTRPLNPANTYRLVIINKETGDVDSASTNLIDTARSNFFINEFNRITYSLSFSTNSTIFPYSLTLSTPNNAKYFEGYIRFRYVTKENGVQKDSSFIWQFATNVSGNAAQGNNLKLEVPTATFYSIVKANIPPAGPNQLRYIDTADVFVWAADRNYYNYMVGNMVQGGITAEQIKPVYTTIQGKDAIGVFGSRAMRIRMNVPLDNATVDSLKSNNLTRDIRFDGRSDH